MLPESVLSNKSCKAVCAKRITSATQTQGMLACAKACRSSETCAVCSTSWQAHLMALWQEAGLSMVTKP